MGRPERRAAMERLASVRGDQIAGHQLLSEALAAGDMAEMRALFDDDAPFPNVEDPYLPVSLLVLAVDHASVETVRELLEVGADPNLDAPDGFPPLYSAVTSHRPERRELIEVLLGAGADPNQRGINDFTVLHAAAQMGDGPSVDLLLQAGADPTIRTRIDDCETPAETAAEFGHPALAERLAQAARQAQPPLD